MKLTRRVFGESVAAAAAVVLAPASFAQTAPPPDAAQRNWLAEARESRAQSARALARIALPIDTEPAFRFRA